MARVQRFDLGTLSKPREREDGFYIVDGYASRIGVYDYLGADGKMLKELRLEEDVFEGESLDTFVGATFTDDHPADFVTPVTIDDVNCGTVLSAKRDGDYVATTMVITDAETIAKLKSGKRELSVGYTVEHDETPGEHPTYGRYDRIQRKIRVNHLALVDEGRAGPRAAVRMDAKYRDARYQVSNRYPEKHGGVCITVSSRDIAPRELREIVAGAVAKIPEATVAADRSDAAGAGTIQIGWTWEATVYVATEDLSANALMSALGDALSATEGVVVNRCDGRIDLSGTVLANPGKTSHHARNKPMPQRKDNDPNTPAEPVKPDEAAPPAESEVMTLMRQLVESQAELKSLLAQLAQSNADRDAATARVASAEGEAQAAKNEAEAAKADAAKQIADAKVEVEKLRTDAKANLDAEVTARVAILTDANLVLGAKDAEGKVADRSATPSRDIKVAIIKHVDNFDVPADEKRDGYIDALYTVAVKHFLDGRAAGNDVAVALVDAGNRVNLDASANAESEAAKQNQDRASNAWRTPAPKKGK